MKVLVALAVTLAAAAQTTPAEWNKSAAQLYSQARYKEAEAAARRALDSAGANAQTVNPDAGHALLNLAAIYRAMGNLAKAEESALAADRALPPPERTGNRVMLGAIYADQRRYDEAESILKTALEGPAGGYAVAIYNDLAFIALFRGKAADAERYAGQALAAAQSLLPANHPAVAAALNNLAQAYRSQCRYALAEDNFRRAIDIWIEIKGASHPDVGKGFVSLAGLLHERGREAGAEDLYRRAAVIFERALGEDHPQTLVVRNELADVLRAERRFSESAKLSHATLPLLEKAFAADDPRVIRAKANLSHLLADTGRTLSLKPETFQ